MKLKNGVKMKKLISFLSIVVFLSVVVSANGITLQENTYNINKTSGETPKIDITVTNEESFTFYNIRLDNEDILDITNIPQLSPGQNITIEASVVTDSDFDGVVKIIGDYDTTIGASNESYNINIDPSGLDICDLEIIQGDTITWKNDLTFGDVRLRNIQTGAFFYTISAGEEVSELFDSADEFDYQVYRTGLPFSQVCHLNILGTSGRVHSTVYDDIINLDIDVVFPPTVITAAFLTEEYTLNYNSEVQDIFSIRNDGTNIAKNVHLSGTWFDFDTNDFDIPVGESRNVGYTIKPLIFLTNQTNKSYTNNIVIEGNFGTLSKGINIDIPFQQLSDNLGNLSVDEEAIINLVNFYCSVRPDKCPKTVVNANESNSNVTFTITEQTYRDSILSSDIFRDQSIKNDNKLAEEIVTLKENYDVLIDIVTNSSSSNQKIEDNLNDFMGVVAFGLIMTLITATLGIIGLLFYQHRKKDRVFKFANIKKNERIW